MSVQLNHTIVHSRDREASAEFLATVLGLEIGAAWGPFLPVTTANGVTLDFATVDPRTITPQHYAFLISEEEFDAAYERIRRLGVTYYPGPSTDRPGEINHNDGGRGMYFADPSGHFLEIITRPYGSGEAESSSA